MVTIDSLSFLIENGMSLDDIQDKLGRGITLEEMAAAVKSISERNIQEPAEATDIDGYLKKIKPEKTYAWNDMGMARLFSDCFIDDVRYNVTAKEWFFYDGRIWRHDLGGMTAAGKAKKLADSLLLYAVKIPDEKTKTDYVRFVSKYGSFHNRKTLVNDAMSENPISQADLDSNKDFFNCQNGVFDFSSFSLLPHKPGYLLSKISNVWYDPEAKSEAFSKFVAEIMENDTEKILFLQKKAGIALTTDTSQEKMLILYGATTRNGKSTFLETLSYMMGGDAGYSLTMPPETIAQRKNRDTRQASGDIARLDGCRLLVASEPPKRMLFDAALLKTLLGRDTITARNLYEREFQFIPVFKMFMNTNFLPMIQDDTLFSSGRIEVLPFNRHFSPEEQDTGLKDRLREKANISALFNWCLDGLRLYKETGINPPESVLSATKAYRESSDKTANFIADCLEHTGKNTGAGTVYRSYQTWCNENGFGTESKRNFFEELKAKGIYAERGMVNGVQVRNIVVGYQLIYDDPPPPDIPPEWQ